MRLVALGLPLLCLPACMNVGAGAFFVVESTYAESTARSGPAEVTVAAKIDEDASIALRAPDSCLSESVTAEIVHTDCGVEMLELERALAMMGFRVISWEAVRGRTKDRDYFAAAKTLNADVLLQVNVIGLASEKPLESGVWTRDYYSSDRDGTKNKRASVSRKRAAALVPRELLDEEKHRTPPPRASVGISASVARTSDGEAILFFAWNAIEEPETVRPARELLICSSWPWYADRCELWEPPTSWFEKFDGSERSMGNQGNGVSAYVETLRRAVRELAQILREHSAPFDRAVDTQRDH